MNGALLEVRGASYAYGARPALTDVEFRADPGECIAVVGRNGSGKSTLLHVLAGLIRPHSGEVLLEGRPLDSYSDRQRAHRICHLPQQSPAGLAFTVEQVVLMGRYAGAEGWFESSDDERACSAALEQLDLLEFRGRRISTLSGGERQRVLLAACLAQGAKAMLLDEPAASLDIDHQLAVMELLRKECAKGRLVIAVMHDLNLALRFGTRLLVMDSGRVVADAPAGRALSQTAWLDRLSPRLRLETSPGGQAWIRY